MTKKEITGDVKKKPIGEMCVEQMKVDYLESMIVPSPKEIKAYLDKYVIGQDEAKKVLSVAIHNHYTKLKNNARLDLPEEWGNEDNVELDKSNVLILGETGSGKTYMIRKIAEMLNVPCYIQDCTKITESGYVGSDVESCLSGLLQSCNFNLPACEMGIVVLDEVDKLAKTHVGPNLTKDPGGEGVQQSLLKIVEGDLVGVPPAGGRKHPEQKLIYVDTKNILFIGIGAFVGMNDVVKRRLCHTSVGYNIGNENGKDDAIKNDEFNNYVVAQDVKEFGMIPEFVGRFPIITNVNKLTVDDLIRILKEPANSLVKQYTTLMSYEGVDLQFTDEALAAIAELSIKLKTGARGLRNIMESVMTDMMFEESLNCREMRKENITIVIDEDYVREKTDRKFRNLKAA